MRESARSIERVGDAKRVNWAEVGIGEILGDYGLSSQAEDQFCNGVAVHSEIG